MSLSQLEFVRAEESSFQAAVSGEVETLRGVLDKNPGPWGYRDLVHSLIDQLGARPTGYAGHPVDVLISDRDLQRDANGALIYNPSEAGQ